MDIERFIRQRRPVWDKLEHLLDLAEKTSDREIGHERANEILSLYRQTSSDLIRMRSLTANPELLGRINQLAGRAYRFIYRGVGGRRLPGTARRFFLVDVPLTFRKERRFVLHAALAMLLGVIVGAGAVLIDPSAAERLIPSMFFSESPRERVEAIESGEERIDSLDDALQFGASLYTHNIRVTFLAFSLGALTIIGAYWLLFYNGVILGAVAAAYLLDGVTVFFVAWVGPHGALELPAIVFGAAAGLRAGHALLLPGELSRGDAVRAAMPSVWRMLLTTAAVLVLAGLIEGGFSQFSAKTFPYAMKILVAALLFVALVSYLFLRQIRSSSEEA